MLQNSNWKEQGALKQFRQINHDEQDILKTGGNKNDAVEENEETSSQMDSISQIHHYFSQLPRFLHPHHLYNLF